jgi:hypothetical protein
MTMAVSWVDRLCEAVSGVPFSTHSVDHSAADSHGSRAVRLSVQPLVICKIDPCEVQLQSLLHAMSERVSGTVCVG